jgi:DNA-binding MarR family transcriptional regulator
VSIRLLRESRKDDAKLGVTAARLSALSVLVFGGPQTLRRLAEIEQVSQPTMTRIAAALARGGYARRRVDPSDRRFAILEATPKGRRLLDDGRRRRESRLAALLDRLTPEQLEACAHAADVLTAALARPSEPA